MSDFNFIFTVDHLRDMIPGNREVNDWYQALCDMLPKYNIITVERSVGFITQCAHESNNFRTLEENLNYSVAALNRVFPRYFGAPPRRNANDYARNPEKLANYVYMDQFRTPQGALGNTRPGDGWRFRGRGIKQLTGRNNYAAFGKTVGMTAEKAAEYVATKKGAIESACWFWHRNNLNRFADRRDIDGLSRAINGGTIGLQDRRNRWFRGLAIFEISNNGVSNLKIPNVILRRGSRGPEVVRLQKALGISADGNFGPMTETALKTWQKNVGLTPDGIAGPKTFGRLYQ